MDMYDLTPLNIAYSSFENFTNSNNQNVKTDVDTDEKIEYYNSDNIDRIKHTDCCYCKKNNLLEITSFLLLGAFVIFIKNK
jgi:hypothetical protein